MILTTLLWLVPAVQAGFDHSHAAWDALLKAAVHPGGRVDYPALIRVRPRLDAYLESLQAVRPEDFRRWGPPQQEAFWINAYNAFTVRLVLDNYPLESIKDAGSLFSSVFSKEFIPLEHLSPDHDDPLSLGELEHEILGRRAGLPLFHFAIVCASVSCPPLRPEAYVPARLRGQLEEQARLFLADASKNDTAVRDGRIRVSKIFDWSEDELKGYYPGGIPGILRDFGPPAVAGYPRLDKVSLKYRDYDWSLNLWTSPAR